MLDLWQLYLSIGSWSRFLKLPESALPGSTRIQGSPRQQPQRQEASTHQPSSQPDNCKARCRILNSFQAIVRSEATGVNQPIVALYAPATLSQTNSKICFFVCTPRCRKRLLAGWLVRPVSSLADEHSLRQQYSPCHSRPR
jgi:hypothetical protein